MENAIEKTPTHVWIVGGLATLWNAWGGYNYLMTRTRNMEFLSQMPGVDPGEMLAYIDSFPIWAQFGWGLGVWSGLLGSLLLLARSRYAALAFALSFFGMVLSFGYQFAGPPPPAGTQAGMMAYIPYVIIAVGVALLLYARAMQNKGVLR